MIAFALTVLLQASSALDSASPAPRYGHRAVYDERNGVVVMFGGRTIGKRSLGDTWLFDGVGWRQVQTPGPSPRAWAGLAYDSRRGVVVLFGGRDSANRPLDDVWEFRGTRWTPRQISSGPRARDHHAMAYDPTRDAVVVHGGDGGGEHLGDAWLLREREWVPLGNSGPGARAAHQMVFVQSRRALVLHGGLRARDSTSVEVLGDSWELTADWRRIEARVDPRSHFGFAAWDACACVVRFAGGDAARVPVATTNMLRGTEWDAHDRGGPPARVDQPMVQLGHGGSLVIFGGYIPTPGGEVFDDTWVLRPNTTRWEQLRPGRVGR